MSRVRWLAARWPVSMRALATRMNSAEYVRGALDGFLIDRVRDSRIEARFVEQLAYQETVVDPFGGESVLDRVSYRSTPFVLTSAFPQIELRDPQRSTRDLLNRILEFCDFRLSVQALDVDLLAWSSHIGAKSSIATRIDAMQASGIELQPGVMAKMVLKGEGDIGAALRTAVGRKTFHLDSVQLRIDLGGRYFPVQMSSAGTARLPDEHKSDLLPLLRSALPGAAN